MSSFILSEKVTEKGAPSWLKRSSFSTRELRNRTYSFIRPRSNSLEKCTEKFIEDEKFKKYKDNYEKLENEKKQVQEKYIELFRNTYNVVYVVYRDSGCGTSYRKQMYITSNAADEYIESSDKSDDWHHDYYVKEVAVCALTNDDVWYVQLK